MLPQNSNGYVGAGELCDLETFLRWGNNNFPFFKCDREWNYYQKNHTFVNLNQDYNKTVNQYQD